MAAPFIQYRSSWICLLAAFVFGLAFEPVAGQQNRDLQETSAAWIDGKEVRLTTDGRVKHDPVFINAGKSIVYTSQEKFNQLCLMQLDLGGDQKPKRFHVSANTSELMAAFARDEKRYAYIRNNGNLHFEIAIEDKTTGESVKYNPGGGFAGVRNISFHPDGSYIIFAFPDQNGPQQIKSLAGDGKQLSSLTNSEGINACPKYSSDGKQIVFSSSRDGDFDIFLMNSDGSQPTNITRSKGLDTHPSLSPDGKEIVFTAIRNGNYDIYIVKTDGTSWRQVTRHDEVDDYATWSADGKSVVWVGERNGKRDLYQKKVH